MALLPEAEAQRTRRGGVKGAQAAYGLPAQLTPTPAAAALPPIVLLQLELPLAPMLAVAATARERGCSVALKASCIPPPPKPRCSSPPLRRSPAVAPTPRGAQASPLPANYISKAHQLIEQAVELLLHAA